MANIEEKSKILWVWVKYRMNTAGLYALKEKFDSLLDSHPVVIGRQVAAYNICQIFSEYFHIKVKQIISPDKIYASIHKWLWCFLTD